MNAIIFSKSRPLQLDCLLRSLYENCNHFSDIAVLWTGEYKDSYEVLSISHPHIRFIPEQDFKHDFMSLVADSDHKVCLLVDDDIIFRPVKSHELTELMTEVDIVSLRLGNNITKREHFRYKGSLDGNIYDRALLLMLSNLRFDNPNKLEIQLCKLAKGTMGWFNESKLIGIPHNRVSCSSNCSYMTVDTYGLNELFLTGYVIDWKRMDLEYHDVHKYISYVYKSQ